jgi:hypothetical protein
MSTMSLCCSILVVIGPTMSRTAPGRHESGAAGMSIRDWYSNSEDSGWDAPGRDRLDDDRPDRSVDGWLDRATPRHDREPSAAPVHRSEPAGRRATPRNERSRGRPASPRSSRVNVVKSRHKQHKSAQRLSHLPPPRWRDILQAVHEELVRGPRRSAAALHEVLVRTGGSFGKLRLADVEEAMAAPARRATTNRPKPPPAAARPAVTNPGGWVTAVPREPLRSRRQEFIGLPIDPSAFDAATTRGRARSTNTARSAPVRGLALVGVCSSCSGPIQENGTCRCSR